LGSRAVGGAAAVIAEATSVSPEGRISPDDTGIWNEKQIDAFLEITKFIKTQNSIAGIQLAHAGRKAGTASPWKGHKSLSLDQGGWIPLAPSALAFDEASHVPRELTKNDIKIVTEQFVQAAKNSLKAG